ncbi:MAG: hypothetical protein U1E27_01825, partial [Kiritimatiellia bacterium]|nr:hypothetical protein [Kiritimatiellia bacterium]
MKKSQNRLHRPIQIRIGPGKAAEPNPDSPQARPPTAALRDVADPFRALVTAMYDAMLIADM